MKNIILKKSEPFDFDLININILTRRMSQIIDYRQIKFIIHEEELIKKHESTNR
jgi:hypothetical protein